jgi:hypothetical protein
MLYIGALLAAAHVVVLCRLQIDVGEYARLRLHCRQGGNGEQGSGRSQ